MDKEAKAAKMRKLLKPPEPPKSPEARATSWCKEDLDDLEKNFRKMNNAKLAARLTVASRIPRSVQSVASKLRYLNLRRSAKERKEVCGHGPGGKHCPCCLSVILYCKCIFIQHPSYSSVAFCQLHRLNVYREGSKGHERNEGSKR